MCGGQYQYHGGLQQINDPTIQDKMSAMKNASGK